MPGTRAEGIDASHHNGALLKVASQVSYAIVQCTVGTWPDPEYTDHLAELRIGNPDILLGAYHYAVYGPGPTRQARAFLARVGAHARFLAVDAEARGSNGILHNPRTIRAIIANIRKLDPHHRKILLYSSRGTWPGELGQDGNWVADYRGLAPDKPDLRAHLRPVQWLFWQTDGIGLDNDLFNGTEQQLRAWIG